MCSIVGFVNLKHDLQNRKEILEQMIKKLAKHTSTKENFYLAKGINLGCQSLAINDKKTDAQPMSIKHNDNTYTIVFNGRLYNANEMKNTLLEKGFTFIGTSVAEVVLKAFISRWI